MKEYNRIHEIQTTSFFLELICNLSTISTKRFEKALFLDSFISHIFSLEDISATVEQIIEQKMYNRKISLDGIKKLCVSNLYRS